MTDNKTGLLSNIIKLWDDYCLTDLLLADSEVEDGIEEMEEMGGSVVV